MNIYKITNLINGKIYVGKDTKDRRSYYGSGIVIKQAIKKYGKKNFRKEILEKCSDYQILNEREKYWIEKLHAIRPSGYNICSGGEGGDVLTNHPRRTQIIAKMKLRASSKEYLDLQRQYHLGKSWGNHTAEGKVKISKSNKGKIFTKKHKKNLSIARKKRITKPETVEKMRKSMLGKNVDHTEYILTDKNGKEYHTDNLYVFCKEHKICKNNLYKVLSGNRKDANGFKIRRVK